MAIISYIIVTNRLLKKGTSPTLRKKVVIRCTFLFMLYLISILYAIDDQIDLFGKLFPNKGRYYGILQFTYLIMNTSGLLMAICRFSEPYVFEQFKKLFKRNKAVKADKFSEESLCHFVNSVMNIEFVYLILIGINNFYDRRLTTSTGNVDKMMSIKRENDRRVTVIQFNQVNYKDIAKWDIGEIPGDETVNLKEAPRNSLNGTKDNSISDISTKLYTVRKAMNRSNSLILSSYRDEDTEKNVSLPSENTVKV